MRGVVEGELYFEPLDRAPYAHDASLYEIDPLGVVVPRSEHDVVNVVRYAAENRIAVHVRGAGTDTGGGSLGPGLVVDLSRHLRQVIAIGPEHVVVEAGVVLDVLNAQLAPLGRRLEPVPHNSDVTTVGGMIAVDAAGPRSMKYGSTGDQVDRLRVVFAQGEVADVGFEPWPAFESEPADFKDLVVRKLQTIFRNSEGRLREARAAVPRNRAGYALARAAERVGNSSGPAAGGLGRDAGRDASGRAAHGSRFPPPAASCCWRFAGLLDAAAFVERDSGAARSVLLRATCSTGGRSAWRATPTRSFRGWIDEAAEAILTVEFEGDEPDAIAARLRGVQRDGGPDGHAGLRALRDRQAGGVRSPAGPAPAGRAPA